MDERTFIRISRAVTVALGMLLFLAGERAAAYLEIDTSTYLLAVLALLLIGPTILPALLVPPLAALGLVRRSAPERARSAPTARAADRVPVAVTTIILVNVAVFLVMLAQYGLMDPFASGQPDVDVSTLTRFGAKTNALIRQGQHWRLLAHAFVHIGIVHLLVNACALYALGRLCESIYGSRRFLILYVASGIAGGLGSFLFSDSVSAGASGAVFGLAGAGLVFSLKAGRWLPVQKRSQIALVLMLCIAVNIAFGILHPQIDNYAHLGGLCGGVLVSLLLRADVSVRRRRRSSEMPMNLFFALTLVALGHTGLKWAKEAFVTGVETRMQSFLFAQDGLKFDYPLAWQYERTEDGIHLFAPIIHSGRPYLPNLQIVTFPACPEIVLDHLVDEYETRLAQRLAGREYELMDKSRQELGRRIIRVLEVRYRQQKVALREFHFFVPCPARLYRFTFILNEPRRDHYRPLVDRVMRSIQAPDHQRPPAGKEPDDGVADDHA